MANHIRNQHVRAQQPQQHLRHNQTAMEKFQHMFSSHMQRIRSTPKMSFFVTMLIIILCIFLLLGVLHYFRVLTLPFADLPQKQLAPASHLQYFFF